MSIRGKALIAGAFEHPDREIPDKSVAQIHAEVATGALLDAGLTFDDVDGYFCGRDAPGLGPSTMVEYLGLRKVRVLESTDFGGSAPIAQVAHAAAAIAAGQCHVALITLGGRPRSEGVRVKGSARPAWGDTPDSAFESPFGLTAVAQYALGARRHMYQYGTTSEQLAEVKVAAAFHASHNPHALLRDRVSVEEVVASPLVADPLHRLDCCVITDGGGALVVVGPEIARDLRRHCVTILGEGEAEKHTNNGRVDPTFTGAVWSGPRAFDEARVTPDDIDYASIYDSFTITVLETIEDLGFCEKGDGGRFVMDGALQAPDGKLPFNTDGGGLCNNHPQNRGGMTKVIEAVRQLRGEANPGVQVPDCELALAHGTGGTLVGRHVSVTLILGREMA